MELETDHRFYSPVLNQIADLLKGDYVVKYDSTEDHLGGPSFTVIHKKYKSHGLNISTYLNSNPEWTIRSYVSLPLEIVGLSYYKFTPERDSENFPLLTKEQLNTISVKIKTIEKDTLKEIQGLKHDLETGMMGLSYDYINSYYT